MTPEIKSKFIMLDQNNDIEGLNLQLILFSRTGDFESVKYLLTSPELNNHANIHHYEEEALIWAATNGHLEIVKYLLNSAELKERASMYTKKELAFKTACFHKNYDIVAFMVFDMNIELTNNIQADLTKKSNKHIVDLFNLRELNFSLKKELIQEKTQNTTVKI